MGPLAQSVRELKIPPDLSAFTPPATWVGETALVVLKCCDFNSTFRQMLEIRLFVQHSGYVLFLRKGGLGHRANFVGYGLNNHSTQRLIYRWRSIKKAVSTMNIGVIVI